MRIFSDKLYNQPTLNILRFVSHLSLHKHAAMLHVNMQCRSFQYLVLDIGVHICVHNSHSFCILTALSSTKIPNRFTEVYRDLYCHTATSVMPQPHVLKTV